MRRDAARTAPPRWRPGAGGGAGPGRRHRTPGTAPAARPPRGEPRTFRRLRPS